MTTPDLPPRVRAVLDIIAAAAAEGLPTPTGSEIEAEMRAAGLTTWQVSKDIARLVEADLIAVHGGKRRRVFEILATGQCTEARAENVTLAARAAISARVRERCSDWPRPTRSSISAYDAAMKQGAPIRIQGPAAGAETWTHLPARAAAPSRSLTGCSAALSAEVV